MFLFILGIVLVVLAIVAGLVRRSANKTIAARKALQAEGGRGSGVNTTNAQDLANASNVAKWVLGGVAVLLLLLSVVRVVPANNVGIPTTFGAIGSPKSSGFHVTAPWTKISNFSTRVQELSMLAAPDEGDKEKDDSIEVIAKGGGSMKVDITIRYFVVADKADVLFRQAGTMDLIKQRFVRPDAREVTRNVFSLYTAEEGYSTQRATISQAIFVTLGPRLLQRGILVDSVNVRDVNPEAQVLTAINGILQSRNDALKAAEDQVKQITEAETRKEVAERDKQSTITKAEANAESVTIAANAQAAANSKIAASLTPTLADLEKTRACADAIARTQATVVNVCGEGGSGGGVVSTGTGVIIDAR